MFVLESWTCRNICWYLTAFSLFPVKLSIQETKHFDVQNKGKKSFYRQRHRARREDLSLVRVSDPADRSCGLRLVNGVRGKTRNALGICRTEKQDSSSRVYRTPHARTVFFRVRCFFVCQCNLPLLPGSPRLDGFHVLIIDLPQGRGKEE